MLSLMSQKPTPSQKLLEENGRNLIIKDLLSGLGVDLNNTDSDGNAPLHQYAETNNLIMGALLLTGGADVNMKTKGDLPGKTPLHITVERGHVDFVKLLVQWKANVNEQNDINQKTVLHLCAEKGNKDIFDILLAAGADVNLADSRGKTALHLCAKNGNNDIFDILLAAGADVNLSNKSGKTALHYAVVRGYNEIIKSLLKRGADINRTNVKGRTPLHYCAKFGTKDMIVFLLEAGALANIRDNEGKTPLHSAVQFANNEKTKTLVTCKDILDITDDNGKTALHYSVQKPFENSVLTETLLKANVKVNIRDKEGKTALHYAAMFGYQQTVEILLKYTDGLDIGDNLNQTALHHSSKSGDLVIMEMLLEAGAGVDVKDQYGKTPLHYIPNRYASEVVEVLVQHGANLDIVDYFGQTALDVATQEDHYRVVKVLKQHGAKSSKDNQEEKNTVLDCSTFPEAKSTIDTTPIDWSKTTQCANVDFSQGSDDTTTTPTGSITTIFVTTPSTDTALDINVTSTACTTTADESDDTTTSTDTIPSTFTTQIVHTASALVTSTNSLKQITSSTTKSTDTINTSQLKHPRKSTHKIYKSHENHNITQTNLETLGENGLPCLEKHKMLDDSDSGQKNLSPLSQTKDKKDMMVEQEKTRLGSIVKNKTIIRNKDKRKKIFDQLMRHHDSDDVKNPTKIMRNSSSVRKPKKGESNLLRSVSADSLESSTKYFRKRIRPIIHDMKHQSRMTDNSYRRKYFWKYKSYDKKRIKKTNVKSTNFDLNHSTKPSTLEWGDVGYVNETEQAKTQILTQNEVSLPVQTVLDSVQWALITEMTRNCGNTVNTIVNVNINYTAIRDCNEVNIENVKYLAIDGKIGGQDG